MPKWWTSINKYAALNVICAATLWSVWNLQNEICFQGAVWKDVRVLLIKSKNAEVETGLQRKRLAVPGRMVYCTRDEGGATFEAWVGTIPANDFAYVGLQPCVGAGVREGVHSKRPRGSVY